MRNRQKNQGFTLIETVVSLAVFGVIIVAVLSTFVSGLNIQRKNLALQEAQNDLRYALEAMSREIRMSHINTADGFHDGSVDFLDITIPAGRVYYRLIAGGESGQIGLIARYSEPITSYRINITALNFYIYRNQATLPTTVTIAIKAETIGAYAGQEIDLQTTVSTRDYE